MCTLASAHAVESQGNSRHHISHTCQDELLKVQVDVGAHRLIVCVCVCVSQKTMELKGNEYKYIGWDLNKKFDFIIDKICSSLIPVTYELPSFLLDKDFEL